MQIHYTVLGDSEYEASGLFKKREEAELLRAKLICEKNKVTFSQELFVNHYFSILDLDQEGLFRIIEIRTKEVL